MGGVERPSRRKCKPGDQFGLWTVIRFAGAKAGYVCRCQCGKEAEIPTTNLTKGKSRGCVKCVNRDLAKARSNATALGIPQRDYDRLAGRGYAARSRCTDPTSQSYPSYGGRGITFEFETIREYVEHLITLPGWDNPRAEIDRIDNDLGYARGNVRFTDRSGNANNTRVNRLVEWEGQTYTAVQFHRKFCPLYRCRSYVKHRLDRGDSPSDILARYVRYSERRAKAPLYHSHKQGADDRP